MELYILETGSFPPLIESWGLSASSSAGFCKAGAWLGEEIVFTIGAHP